MKQTTNCLLFKTDCTALFLIVLWLAGQNQLVRIHDCGANISSMKCQISCYPYARFMERFLTVNIYVQGQFDVSLKTFSPHLKRKEESEKKRLLCCNNVDS